MALSPKRVRIVSSTPELNENGDEVDLIMSEGSDGTDGEGAVRGGVDRHECKSKLANPNGIPCGRVCIAVVLLATALGVTLATYYFQVDQQNSFEVAFEQYARALESSALSQQAQLRHSFQLFSNQITGFSQTAGASWPFFTVPYYETYAEDFLLLTGADIVSIANVVSGSNSKDYINYAGYGFASWVENGHLLKWGNLDRLRRIGYHPYISRTDDHTDFTPDIDRDYFFPSWTVYPPPSNYSLINWNEGSDQDLGPLYSAMLQLKNETLALKVRPYPGPETALSIDDHAAIQGEYPGFNSDYPHTLIYHAVHEQLHDPESPIVAVIGASIAWDSALRNILPEKVTGLDVVIQNSCDQVYSYEINGADVIYLGEGDKHDKSFNHFETAVDLALHEHPDFAATPGHCMYKMYIYPTMSFKAQYDSKEAEHVAGIVLATFVFVIVVFFTYDLFIERSNRKVMEEAQRSNAIVSSLFPESIRDRILARKAELPANSVKQTSLRSYLTESQSESVSKFDSKPLADLFLETTIMFADLVGFTAWSSQREPTQVFTLLETVYSSFDDIARQRKVFKVETVGDCYVAAAGVPEPRKDHAIAMCRFARDCLLRMDVVAKQLEVALGPDTGELTMRIGLHSGPVTAGVLRGERSRFQLFGDTMNTASRIESTGERGRIQVSQETADLLVAAQKGHWLKARDQKVTAKGKGEIQTYWLSMSDTKGDETDSAKGNESLGFDSFHRLEKKEFADASLQTTSKDRSRRLIDWNVDLLLRLLRQIVAHRNAVSSRDRIGDTGIALDDRVLPKKACPLEEVCEIITLPDFNAKAARKEEDPDDVEISHKIVMQLRDYVTKIAGMYHDDNPFHNFDHASHVVMSVGKLMSRIIAPTDLREELEQMEEVESKGSHEKGLTKKKVAASLHDHTYGITSDPLTQFACAFSALIHDVDHTGVPNAQLIEEKIAIAGKYQNRSVAEQNSLDISWKLLMDSRYAELRATLVSSVAELKRFRQLVVNSVMATDIVDKDLKALRNGRWDKAFKNDCDPSQQGVLSSPHMSISGRDDVNRKATIVIEHLIQASDVAHTMQHWHIYRKWNENLFKEMTKAYRAGRAAKDPSEFWYKGELGFFDFYIIPLAKKLKDCGVFGISSDEYLNYATRNRQEWEIRGQEIVAEMIARYCLSCDSNPSGDNLPSSDSLHQNGSTENMTDDGEISCQGVISA